MKNIETCLYNKDYSMLEMEMKATPKMNQNLEDQLLYDYTGIKIELYKIVQEEKEVNDFEKYQKLIADTSLQYANKIDPVVFTIHELAMRSFLFEVSTDESNLPKENAEKEFFKDISKLPMLSQVADNGQVMRLMATSLYFSVTLMEIYVKKFTLNRRKQTREELTLLSKMIEQLSKARPETLNECKKLYTIALHLKLHNTNSCSVDLQNHIEEYLDLSIQKLSKKNFQLIETHTVVVMLYNCLKIIVGFNEINPKLYDPLEELYKIFSMSNPPKIYSRHVLQLFFVIKIVIFQQSDNRSSMEQNNAGDFKLTRLDEKFSIFLNINMDEIIISLNEITRNIVRHKVASLSTIIGAKLRINRFSKDFLQIMHDSPFNNDIQTIKLCLELFEFREFEKMENLLATVLSVPATKDLKEREVLVAMSSIFIGLYLKNRSEGLLYCKLNHEHFLSNQKNNSNNKQILKEETFLEHVGFGYYILACHEVYLQNRLVYMNKALENFLLSYEINSENYLLNYCLGKIYLQLYDYNNAHKYAMQSSKSHRGSWAPFCLLACVYMCERKFQKAYILVEQLIKKHSQVAVLNYVKAYLEVNKILLEVQHDEEIESAKLLGEECYTNHFERILKSKSIHSVIKYCQRYYQLSMGLEPTETDENFFTAQNISEEAAEGEKYLFQIIKLLIEIGQYNTVENILKLLPHNLQSTIYYKAVLHEKRKEWKEAKIEYHNILKINPCQCESLIKLSCFSLMSDSGNYDEAERYLQLAGKFVNNSDYVLAKGMLLSKQGKIKQANEALLSDVEIAWCNELPDLFYYY